MPLTHCLSQRCSSQLRFFAHGGPPVSLLASHPDQYLVRSPTSSRKPSLTVPAFQQREAAIVREMLGTDPSSVVVQS